MTVGSVSKSFWGGLRIGWIRAERGTLATIARACARPSTWSSRSSNSSPPRTFSPRPTTSVGRAPRHIASPAFATENASARTSSGLDAQREPRRYVAVGAVAGTDQLRTVGGRHAARACRSARPTLRRRRHAGAIHPGALHAARRPACRGGGTAGQGVAQRHPGRRRRPNLHAVVV